MKQIRPANSTFCGLILSIVVLTIIVASSAPASAQKKFKAKTPKTRAISIYVYDAPSASTEFPQQRIVPVRRTIADNNPLSRALKLLLVGVNPEEQERNLIGIGYDFKFVSVRVKNRTAQINFKFKYEESIEESWEGSGFKNEDFVKAVELTATQFPGIERVSICVNGIANYADFGSDPVKCSFGMFVPQHRKQSKR